MSKKIKKIKNFSELKKALNKGQIDDKQAYSLAKIFYNSALEDDDISGEEYQEMEYLIASLNKRINEKVSKENDDIDSILSETIPEVNDSTAIKAIDEMVAESGLNDLDLPDGSSERVEVNNAPIDTMPSIPQIDITEEEKELDSFESFITGSDKKAQVVEEVVKTEETVPIVPPVEEVVKIEEPATLEQPVIKPIVEEVLDGHQNNESSIPGFQDIDQFFEEWDKDIGQNKTFGQANDLTSSEKNEIDDFVDEIAKKTGIDAQIAALEAETRAVAESQAIIKETVSIKRKRERTSSLDSRNITDKVEKSRKDSISDRRKAAKEVDYIGKFGELVKQGYDKAKKLLGKVFGSFGKEGKARAVINSGIGEIVAAPGNIKDNVVYGASAVKEGAIGVKDSIVAKASSAKKRITGFASDIGKVVRNGSESVKSGKVILTGKKQDLAIAIGKGIRGVGKTIKTTGTVLATAGIVATAPVWGTAKFIKKSPEMVLSLKKNVKKQILKRQLNSAISKREKLDRTIMEKDQALKKMESKEQFLKEKNEQVPDSK